MIFFMCGWELLTKYTAFGVIKMLFSYTIVDILLDELNYLYCCIKMGSMGTLGLTRTGVNGKISNILWRAYR